MELSFTYVGVVFKVEDTKTFENQDTKYIRKTRNIILEEEGKYNNYPCFEFIQNNVPKLDRINPGDEVWIKFRVSGIKYTNKNSKEESFMTKMTGWDIGVIREAVDIPHSSSDIEIYPASNSESSDDDLPF